MQRIEAGDRGEIGRSPMENLPGEIIFDILSRVPAKSLLRFRCVCKSWRSLIFDTQFVKTHLHRAAISDVNVGCRRVLLPTSPFFQSIDFEAVLNNNGGNKSSSSSSSTMVLEFFTRHCDLKSALNVSVTGSCDGLVCFVANRDKIIVCNPCTRESRELPRPSIMPPIYGFLANGFGYDSSVDDYKVVIAARPTYHSGNATQMEVFSLKGNSWKRIDDIPRSISLDMGNGIFLDGALHWIASRRRIVSFDLATEKFQELVPLPPNQGDWIQLVVLGGCLSIVYRHIAEFKYVIWILKEYGVEASWTKLFVYQTDHWSKWTMEPLFMSKNGEVLLDMHCIELKMYNPKERTSRNLDTKGSWHFSASTYIETLVSTNGNQA